jgi:hypothetical protein
VLEGNFKEGDTVVVDAVDGALLFTRSREAAAAA